MMKKAIQGLHHISAIVGNPNEVIEFYRDILGLRLVKQTVNYDDPYTYHLYFSNHEAAPGFAITFFPWENTGDGKLGDGQVAITSYQIPLGSLEFWRKRLTEFGIEFEEKIRFGQLSLILSDFHGLIVELVEKENGSPNTYQADEEMSAAVAIQGFAGAVIFSRHPEKTNALLTDVFGWQEVQRENDYVRFLAPGDRKEWLDIRQNRTQYGEFSTGTVHHIAFRVKDVEELNYWQQTISAAGYKVTEIKNRGYFHALYFREKGGTLFELATEGPGFTINETISELGQTLFIPDIHKAQTDKILAELTPLNL